MTTIRWVVCIAPEASTWMREAAISSLHHVTQGGCFMRAGALRGTSPCTRTQGCLAMSLTFSRHAGSDPRYTSLLGFGAGVPAFFRVCARACTD